MDALGKFHAPRQIRTFCSLTLPRIIALRRSGRQLVSALALLLASSLLLPALDTWVPVRRS